MKKKICIVTATRAEYGLLKPVILALGGESCFETAVVATAAHLSPEFGLTYKEIERDGIRIDRKIETLMSSDTPSSVSKCMGLTMISFADYFDESRPDALLVLGDRYETLAVCCAAMNARIPIIHMYGGETTEGAVDEAARHSITKMSALHFTSTETYRKRVIQLGENPENVFCVGAVGIENIKKMQLLDKNALEESISFKLDKPYAVVTFHPVTLENDSAGAQFAELLKALDRHKEMKYIFTKANADANGRIINKMIDDYAASNDNVAAFESLGSLRYLSALKYTAIVIGNSSSGIVEAPSFGIPTINIGDRQKGRIQSESIINVRPDSKEIAEAIDLANLPGFRAKAASVVNPYGDGGTTDKIVKIIKDKFANGRFELKKKFFDVEFNI